MSVLKLAELDQSFSALGKHLVCVDGDIIWFVFRGLIDLPEMVSLVAVSYEMTERYGYTLVLCGTVEAKGATAEARRYQNESHRQRRYPNHTALYGANVFIRGLMVLSQRATELMTGKPTPMSFHKEEAEARDFLSSQRAILSPKLTP